MTTFQAYSEYKKYKFRRKTDVERPRMFCDPLMLIASGAYRCATWQYRRQLALSTPSRLQSARTIRLYYILLTSRTLSDCSGSAGWLRQQPRPWEMWRIARGLGPFNHRWTESSNRLSLSVHGQNVRATPSHSYRTTLYIHPYSPNW